MNKPLVRYSRFIATEFLTHRLAVALILLALVSGLPTYLMTRHSPPGFMQSTEGVLMGRQMFTQSVALFLPLGGFVGVIGLISADRQMGYFRFLFSKPVNVPAYYATTYVVHAIVYVAIFAGIVWLYGAYAVHIPVLGAVEAAVLTFVLLGGLGLLFGAIVRYDGAALIFVYVGGLVLQQLAEAKNGLPNGGLPGWLAVVAKVLPPVTKLDRVRDSMYMLQPIDMSALGHVAGYGIGAGILGFFMLRRLPLAR